ncbi:MAG: tRNA pseudouridine(38-40) synthase TruA [Euryarchaeota archaeon RBG_19FT_COMBO_56_21]|nr:MAG: tRNA pseudouridine(38-40) synthase TruA [Euryarchaeota archaeon RBG_19FT_COMBO_56_21]
MEERRIALKFAYDGTSFHGFQRQPDRRTVEGTLVDALRKVGAIKSSRECGYRSSSRTDRGVSALGNIISFNTKFAVDHLCAAVNSEMEDVWAYAAVEVEQDFNPRFAKQRWYRYFLAKSDQDPDMMKAMSRRFVGVHDFSGYSRRDDRNPMRKIDAINITQEGMFYVIDFRAESFLWNMVRRIVWMIDEGSSSRIPLEQVGPDASRRPRRVGLAPPEYLVLMAIDCGILFPVDRKAAIGISRTVERRVRQTAARVAFSQSLLKQVSEV